MSQFSPFEVGQVKAHLYHGLGPSQIAGIITKADGKTRFSHTAVASIIEKLKNDPKWRGERQEGSGRPRRTTEQEDAALIKGVFDARGKRKVTVGFLQGQFKFARNLGRTAIEDRLHDAQLAFLRRRRKSLVAPCHLPGRVAYCRSVLRMCQRTFLNLWAYTDGTVYYLDRTDAENTQTHCGTFQRDRTVTATETVAKFFCLFFQ